ncbi:glycosyltransferase [Mesorhizobium sp. VNQ89]|uniref:glycosyltransferase family 8 protein n=1 Tax=Mesorhizobium quangtriensis TaxID=3157709 RepID=UPI0032B7005F
MQNEACYFFAADKKYFPYACLAARRVLDVSGKTMPGVILQTGVGREDLDAATVLLGDDVAIVDMSRELEGFAFNTDRLGLAAYMRLFVDVLPAFLPYRSLVYADCDVLFNRSVADLAATPLNGALLAAHDEQQYYDPKYRARLPMKSGAPYFNSGVLVFNMEQVRGEGLLERTRRFAQERRDICLQHDQDALNVVFEGRWQTMDPRWNVMTNFNSQIPFAESFARHFSWGKPWWKPLGVEPEAQAIYREMARNTPWADRFDQSTTANRAQFLLKRFSRKFDGPLGFLTGKEKLRKRAHYNSRHSREVFGAQAAKGVIAGSFPERQIGLG